MAGGVDVGSCAVNGRVDGPAGFIRRARGSFIRVVPPCDGENEVCMRRVVGEEEHVRAFEEAEMDGERVGPEEGGVFRVANGDVAGHAFGVAMA